MAGRYTLSIIANAGGGADTVITGPLELRPTTAIEASPSGLVAYPFSGTAGVDLGRLGRVSLAYSPSSADSLQPGVQVAQDRQHGTYMMVFGNATSPRGQRRDAGVFFDILEWNATGMRGRWSDGGRRANTPHGYFCARAI